jgi:hypothetical protein
MQDMGLMKMKRRPKTGEGDNVREVEGWRTDVMREISRMVTNIQDGALDALGL